MPPLCSCNRKLWCLWTCTSTACSLSVSVSWAWKFLTEKERSSYFPFVCVREEQRTGAGRAFTVKPIGKKPALDNITPQLIYTFMRQQTQGAPARQWKPKVNMAKDMLFPTVIISKCQTQSSVHKCPLAKEKVFYIDAKQASPLALIQKMCNMVLVSLIMVYYGPEGLDHMWTYLKTFT